MQVKGNILVSFLKYFAFFLPFQLRDQNYSNNQVTYLSLSPSAKYLLPYLLWNVIPPIKRCGRITVTLVYKLHTLSPKGHPHFKYSFSSAIKISYQGRTSQETSVNNDVSKTINTQVNGNVMLSFSSIICPITIIVISMQDTYLQLANCNTLITDGINPQ